MNNKIKTILFTLVILMAGTKAYAEDIAVKNADGVTIYYKYINDGKELEVTFGGSSYYKYKGNVVIPEEVTYMNRTRKVTSIGNKTFYQCRDLTSVTIPNSVTSIGDGAFFVCSSLTSVTIPNSVTSIGEYAFYGADIPTVISLITNPFNINSNTFNKNTLLNSTLYVPKGTINKYKSTAGWKDFLFIEEGDGSGSGQSTQRCEKPTISYSKGKLTFNCATSGATCKYAINDTDIKSGSGDEVRLGVTYNISVYATKSGYEDSETATATLCWIDVEPKAEGIVNGVASVRSYGVMIQASEGFFNISGLEAGTPINIYNTAGQMVGSAKAASETTTVNTTLRNGEIGIVKIGDKSVKVLMK